jgi:hypothetical protein
LPARWPKQLTKNKHKTFENVSFSKTCVSKVTFNKCCFKDCLFIGTTFDNVEFHSCKFLNCNFFKTQIENCYLDPKSVKFDKKYKKCASNIGVHIYQQILENSAKSRQSEHERIADIRFRQWKRAQLDYDLNDDKVSQVEYYWKKTSSIIYEYSCGFGYRPGNLIITTIILFLTISVLNMWIMNNGLQINDEIVSQLTFTDSIFYSFSLLTSLGFSTVIPVTATTKIFAVAEALIGIGWLSLFTTVLVRRFLK